MTSKYSLVHCGTGVRVKIVGLVEAGPGVAARLGENVFIFFQQLQDEVVGGLERNALPGDSMADLAHQARLKPGAIGAGAIICAHPFEMPAADGDDDGIGGHLIEQFARQRAAFG